MSNFFLLNETIDKIDYNCFKNGMNELIVIDKDNDDIFIKHPSIYNLPLLEELYINYSSQEEQVIGLFIEQLEVSNIYFNDTSQIDSHFSDDNNGFLGINFQLTQIEIIRQIKNNIDYCAFNDFFLWNVTFRDFWIKKERLFPNLIMCGQVKNQIASCGNSAHFNQIIEKLKLLEDAVANWVSGNFSYSQINNNYALRISPESTSTMNKYGNERRFSLPNGGTELFELHIKTGDLRFHFFPDNQTRKVYIGYIGNHLPTISN
ncbi:hypothetical protein HX071_16530 [Myroides marinus]|uniref:hypothetical protein n=1 Tax=Myroides marinus TaxID=703342 RepID=UPI002576C0FB|nr:hypothetical protein [Myroides marinus]MDM1503785.1 hypothetical protein [Myroides marinus]